jgi:large subunit ribosomal protein L10
VDRASKEELVAELRQSFTSAGVVVVTHYRGLTVAESTQLRIGMREVGASFKVTKNTLARLALQGTAFEGIIPLFNGPTAIAVSSDPVAAAKATMKFAKTNEKLVVLGGGIIGQTLDANGIKALADLPSLDELRGKLIGVLQAPASRIVGVLQAPGLCREGPGRLTPGCPPLGPNPSSKARPTQGTGWWHGRCRPMTGPRAGRPGSKFRSYYNGRSRPPG